MLLMLLFPLTWLMDRRSPGNGCEHRRAAGLQYALRKWRAGIESALSIA